MYVKLVFQDEKENIILKLFFALLTSLLFIGCTSEKNEDLLHTFKDNLDYHKTLGKTEKIQLYDNNETKVMVTATYLYVATFENNDTHDEVFVVGMHLEDEDASMLNQNDYRLTLNNKVAKEVKPLKKDDKHLKDISFITEWGRYYLVTFTHVPSKYFNLVFESSRYGKGMLHFSKVAKYTL